MTEKNSKAALVMVTNVGFFRRFGAIFYDAFLLLAVLFIAAALLLPFNGGDAVTAKYIIIPYYLLVSFSFYGWFWTRSGQTVGLKTWKLRLQTFDGDAITWKLAAIRFLTALLTLGLGGFWALVDKNNYALHDYLSKTKLVFEGEKEK